MSRRYLKHVKSKKITKILYDFYSVESTETGEFSIRSICVSDCMLSAYSSHHSTAVVSRQIWVAGLDAKMIKSLFQILSKICS